jgi:hypothetical protein
VVFYLTPSINSGSISSSEAIGRLSITLSIEEADGTSFHQAVDFQYHQTVTLQKSRISFPQMMELPIVVSDFKTARIFAANLESFSGRMSGLPLSMGPFSLQRPQSIGA